jgi:ABC-2 type transport system permease protein/sodium transport system permease protein
MDVPSAPLHSDNDLGRWLRLSRKELREILRDRRTILTLLVMPLLLYPVLGLGFSYLYAAKELSGAMAQYKIGFENEADGQQFRQLLARGEAVWEEHARRTSGAGERSEAPANIELLFFGKDLEADLREGRLDLVILARHVAKARREGPVEYEAVYDPNSAGGVEAVRFVRSRLVAANLAMHERRVGASAMERAVRMRERALPRVEQKKGYLLAVLVPLVLILMTMTGAVYPAIDLTAGERERGTLEMLMATPISRVALLAAKYVAVLTVAFLTAMVNLVMMAVTFLLFGGPLLASGSAGLSLEMIPIVVGLVILFAAFYAAVLLVLASFARSFKEAQAYVVPLMLLSLVPGLLALVPDFELGLGLALVPLLNIVLLARDLLSGAGDSFLALVVMASTMLYAFGALVLAARTFGAEAVLYRDAGTWSDLLRGR